MAPESIKAVHIYRSYFSRNFYVQDNVSWASGFGIATVGNLIGLVIFLLHYPFYRPHNPQGSAFVDLARVLVASIRKWKSQLSSTPKDYYNEDVLVQPAAISGKRLREEEVATGVGTTTLRGA
ncbi:hypothetical protein Fmac_025121 [Flemingia macrophylla]|uniref:Uncharacterized protein n=1 Tax=Flemingia macrophylla TaxID=520843 RepID=A0ABD1LRF0_9FABA